MKKNALLILTLSLALLACKKNETRSATTASDTVVKTDTVATVTTENSSDHIKNFLNDKFLSEEDKRAITPSDKKFSVEYIDLNGDGKQEKLVYLQSPYYCGSGGCTFVLLNSENELINEFTVMNPPIYVLRDKENGWNILAVKSEGKFRKLSSDGKMYPSNPSVADVADFKNVPNGAVELFNDKSPRPIENF